ncbi:uncharacterized protein BO80DRAFT_368183 [Aspergillus ibericus CBS 121593]|uniref:Uncharacterized protein n=1 Tax=Aspergillus ibericus CBS 121593 TaxID=1448316 RepID=A0A395GNV2_9EURO|nr:hypothetical protein BO80DRAFT_368183 [Aspergillus ibericus CBS 121593]RAK95693.1 hypothetical protein BO80DRAFT_368183 [Aspergillus ibericus CBS 121593]
MSLRDLMRYHRELFVCPVFWIARHLDLTGCRFERIKNNAADGSEEDTRRSSRDALLIEHPLEDCFTPTGRHLWFINTLLYRGSPFYEHRKGTPFFFKNTRIHQPQYTTFVRCDQTPEDILRGSPPVVSYFEYTSVIYDRETRFSLPLDPSGRPDSIKVRINQKLVAAITPKKWTQDPYICRLFVTNVLERKYVHLFEARISVELIAALKDPDRAAKYVAWPTIQHRRLPYKPYETFTERLVAALVAPVPGWSATVTESRTRGGIIPAKRKREEV